MRYFLIAAMALLLFPLPALAKVLDIQEVTSKHGITAWLAEDHNVPVIAMEFAFKNAGSKQDPSDKQGLAQMMSNTMDEGAGELDSQNFQKELQDLSITLRFSANRDDFGGSLKTVSKNRQRAFQLLEMALTQPRFDEEPVERMRKANQARILSSLSNPNWIAARIMNDVAYTGHPYALNSGGTVSSLETITPEDLKNYAARALALDNLEIAVAGDITAEELAFVLDDIFSRLPEKSTLEDIADTNLQHQGQVFAYEKDIPQSVISMVQPGISRQNDDYHIAQLMNYVVGSSGFGSRLTEEIREKRGLTYGIYTYFLEMDHIPVLSLSTSTANVNVEEVIALIKEEWQKIKDQPISEEELKAAQNYLIGSLPLSLTSTGNIAATLLSMKRDNLPLNYLEKREQAIRNATVMDVQRVAQNLMDSEKMVTVIVGQSQGTAIDTEVSEIPNAE